MQISTASNNQSTRPEKLSPWLWSCDEKDKRLSRLIAEIEKKDVTVKSGRKNTSYSNLAEW